MEKYLTLNIDHINNYFSTKYYNTKEEFLTDINIKKYYYLNQIHSDIIHIIDNKFKNNIDGDALITNKVNTNLLIQVADCIPILIYDKNNKVLGLVHSGWKGTLNNITIKSINLMIKEFNSQKENIYVYIYPSIRKCHFETQNDVYSLFENKLNNIDKYTTKIKDKYYLDLQLIIKDNLLKEGINNIIDTSICTYCNSNTFYSYRYNKTDKRNYLVASIKE